MLEERESMFLLCCCQRPLRARAVHGTNGASSGPLFPSDGHSWGRSATQSWGFTPPTSTSTPHPAATSSPLLLPPCPAVPLLGLSCQPAAQRTLLAEGRWMWELQKWVDHRDKYHQTHICPKKMAVALHWPRFLCRGQETGITRPSNKGNAAGFVLDQGVVGLLICLCGIPPSLRHFTWPRRNVRVKEPES